jgi:hypothetical protein
MGTAMLGFDNYVNGYTAAVLGGSASTVLGAYITVQGALNARSDSANSFIAGGISNTITSSTNALVAGGTSNFINKSPNAGIAGGMSNSVAYGYAAVVLGGEKNTAGSYSIVAEQVYTEPGAYITIIGGTLNSASGHYHTIGGGTLNTIPNDVKDKRKADSSSNTVTGGSENTASGLGSAVVGGQLNMATGQLYSVVVGGYINTARSSYAVAVGGSRNKAYSNFATVGGGYMNKANSKFVAIPGGSRNTVNGRYAFVLGAAATVLPEQSGSLSFKDTACAPSADNTLAICADSVQVNGQELLDLFTARRELDDFAAATEEGLGQLGRSGEALGKEVAEREARIEAMSKQLHGFVELQAQHKALKAKLEHVRGLVRQQASSA